MNPEKLMSFMESQTQALQEMRDMLDSVENGYRRAGQTSCAQDAGMQDERATVLGDHRTAPHKLLRIWPSVKLLLSDAGIDFSDAYVMEAEDQGMLHLYSDGEVLSPRDLDLELDLDVCTIRLLCESYLENIHIMHPILNEKLLRKTIEAFCAGYGTGQLRGTFALPIAVTTAGGTDTHRENRKPIVHSLGNALVLLVLALGKVCLHKDPLPGSESTRTGSMDAMPGLSYYAKATQMIGDQVDGNDLIHAQIFLLAGLFKGQLARVKESMSWFQMAGRAVLGLLDRHKLYRDIYWLKPGQALKDDDKGQVRIQDSRHVLIVIAAWSCLQLETDILAELNFPSSGIQEKAPVLLLPLKTPPNKEDIPELGDADETDQTLMYFVAQLFLRKRLNKVHTEIYGPDGLDQPLKAVREMLLGHNQILTEWRDSLPLHLQWKDNEPSATNILSARLRGKYYGARYVISRPFLDYALHIMPHVNKNKMNIEKAAMDAYGNPRDEADVHLFKAIQQMGDNAIWKAVRECIQAAMDSTIAFDGIDGRLIVTNIHGTAHA
jgi:hypothetical protein